VLFPSRLSAGAKKRTPALTRKGIVSCLLLMCRALWAGLRQDYGQALPNGLSLRLVYEDGEGDFVMLQPDEPWATFLSSVRRVIISCQ
jgi:hypothetical protein